MMKSIVAAALALALGSVALAAAAPNTAPSANPHAQLSQKHKAVPCVACHGKTPGTAPSRESCLACHNEEAIVRAGEKFNFTTTFVDPRNGEKQEQKVAINPHDNFHFSRTDECINCHREHHPSTLTCETCHDTAPWGMKPPR